MPDNWIELVKDPTIYLQGNTVWQMAEISSETINSELNRLEAEVGFEYLTEQYYQLLAEKNRRLGQPKHTANPRPQGVQSLVTGRFH